MKVLRQQGFRAKGADSFRRQVRVYPVAGCEQNHVGCLNPMATLEDVLAEAQKNNRVCPQPQRWQQLYELLPNKKRKGTGWEPALPLILSAWWETSAMSKMHRLREHIEWAAVHDCLEQIHSFLLALPEDQWHHVGE